MISYQPDKETYDLITRGEAFEYGQARLHSRVEAEDAMQLALMVLARDGVTDWLHGPEVLPVDPRFDPLRRESWAWYGIARQSASKHHAGDN